MEPRPGVLDITLGITVSQASHLFSKCFKRSSLSKITLKEFEFALHFGLFAGS